MTRRDLLGLLGAGVAGSVLAGCGASTGTSANKGPAHAAEDVRKFYSRPDLMPPVVEVTRSAGRPGAGYVLITPGGPLIVDNRGRPVWYRPVPHASTNLRVQLLRGQPVLTWWEGEITHYGVGHSGVNVILDTSYREIMRVKAANGLHADLHDFLLAADGTAYLIAYREVTADLTRVGGPKRGPMLDCVVQGIDLDTGTAVFEWHSADHIGVAETYQKYSSSSKAPFDPVHVNSIDLTSDGNLLISGRNSWTIYKVDRSSGGILWHLGGKKNNFTRGPGVHFAWQHDARSHPGRILTMFDNEASPEERTRSRGLALRVTETKRIATLVHAYTHPGQKLLAGSQGNLQVLPGGDVLVGWGAEPYFTEYRSGGTPVLDGHIMKGQSYRAFRSPWTGTPTDRPAVAARHRTAGKMTVYASWNGATEVATWSVLGGATRGALSRMGTARRTGFETPIEVRSPPVRFVAAQALDRSGGVLATSPVIRA